MQPTAPLHTRHHTTLYWGPVHTLLHAQASTHIQSLLCTHATQKPCGQCASCQHFTSHTHPDCTILQAENTGSIPVQSLREALHTLHLTPSVAPHRILWLPHAEQALANTQNALLKTLEEPPEHAHIVLCTRHWKTLLPTLRSRCLRVHVPAHTDTFSCAQVLQRHGIDHRLADVLALLVGYDHEAASELQSAHLLPLYEGVCAFLKDPQSIQQCIKQAAEWGADKSVAEHALLLLEVLVCNTLKARLGSQMAWPIPVGASKQAVLQAGAFLQQARQQQVVHPNKTMVLERVLLTLAGHPYVPQAA